MKRIALSLVLGTVALLVTQQNTNAAQGYRHVANRWGERFAQTMPWHGTYYYAPWGTSVSLVVPPVANMQTSVGWGVTQTSMRPIYHQFGRPYPGNALYSSGQCQATPRWPSHTDQFGVYYTRGPW